MKADLLVGAPPITLLKLVRRGGGTMAATPGRSGFARLNQRLTWRIPLPGFAFQQATIVEVAASFTRSITVLHESLGMQKNLSLFG